MTITRFLELVEGKVGPKTAAAMWETRPTRDNPRPGFATRYAGTRDADITDATVMGMIEYAQSTGKTHHFDN